MAEMNEVIQRLDKEIEAFIVKSKNQSADFRMKRLEYYTALRNGLEVMPLNDPQIDALASHANLMETADMLYKKHIVPNEKAPDFTELTFRLVDTVYREERMEKLWERLQSDNESLKDTITQKSGFEAYERAYEICIKNDILMLFEESDISARKIDTLLSFKHPLDAMYQEWLDTDVSHMDMLRDTVENLIHEQDAYLQRQDFITHGETPSEDISIWNAMYDGDEMRFNGEENKADEDLEQ